jgi:hypothetical protein
MDAVVRHIDACRDKPKGWRLSMPISHFQQNLLQQPVGLLLQSLDVGSNLRERPQGLGLVE